MQIWKVSTVGTEPGTWGVHNCDYIKTRVASTANIFHKEARQRNEEGREISPLEKVRIRDQISELKVQVNKIMQADEQVKKKQVPGTECFRDKTPRMLWEIKTVSKKSWHKAKNKEYTINYSRRKTAIEERYHKTQEIKTVQQEMERGMGRMTQRRNTNY